MNQLSFFTCNIKEFESNLCTVFESITQKYNLPSNSLEIVINTSPTTGEETSRSVCIVEQPYPSGLHLPPRKTVIFKYTYTKRLELFIKRELINVLNIDSLSTEIKDLKSDKVYLRIYPTSCDNKFFDYLSYLICYSIDNYESCNTFGCCSRYAICSARKECVHSNILYAKGCYYRKNLESGKVFY